MRFRIVLATLAVVSIAALALTTSAHAQPGSGSGGGGSQAFTCQPWCGGDSTVWPWQYPPGPIIVPLYDHGCQFQNPQTCCMITAWYRYRRVCASPADYYQIEILRFKWDRDDCIIRNDTTFFDPAPMLRVVVFGLLGQNPMGFPPRVDHPEDTCQSNYTVQAATCWNNNWNGGRGALNCSVDSGGYACCKGGYRVCRAIDPFTGLAYRAITWLGQSTATNACTPPCTPSCGAFNEDGIWNKRKDDPPSLSMAPTSGSTDTVTVATSPASIEPKTMTTPQQR